MKVYSAMVVLIGLFFIFTGLFALFNPPVFYALFNPPDFEPTFEKGDIQEKGMLLYLPGIIQLIAGIGFILSKMDDILVFSRTLMAPGSPYIPPEREAEEPGEWGEQLDEEPMTHEDNVEVPNEGGFIESYRIKHELEGMEVYSVLGDYWGKVESVILDKDGRVEEFVAVKGTNRRILKMADVDSADDIILVREGKSNP